VEKIIPLVLSIVCFGSCFVPNTPPPVEFPEKDLEWIIVFGWYRPENPERVERALEEALKSSPLRGGLREGQTIEEKRLELSSLGDEDIRFSETYYCYNEVDRRGATMAVFPYLKARLYDQEGNILEEDFLRFRPDDNNDDYYHFYIYIPYHKEGHILRTLKIEEKKETIFANKVVQTKEDLIRENIPVRITTSGIGFQFQEDTQCHTGR